MRRTKSVHLFDFMTQAITQVALLETPRLQWTRTLPFLELSAFSRKKPIFEIKEHAFSYQQNWTLGPEIPEHLMFFDLWLEFWNTLYQVQIYLERLLWHWPDTSKTRTLSKHLDLEQFSRRTICDIFKSLIIFGFWACSASPSHNFSIKISFGYVWTSIFVSEY